jgi:outer membrane biosynthesis protein TonB
MSDVPLDPGGFRVVLRGYERDQVDAFIREAVERIEALERERAALVARLGEGGVDDRDAQIDAVTSELNRILHAAHEAAEGMRTRASEEAATWRAEAEAETRAQRREAEQAAEDVRGDAWETASGLLDQVKAYSARLTAEAEEDALNIRAAAEREASRYVGQARQDGVESVRHARLEADRMMEDARRESHNLVEMAKLEAEAAQERARALEERRSELMAELDVAQQAIAKLESDLTARKEALATAGAFEPTSTVRVVTEAKAQQDDWFDDDETVRVVAADVALAEPEPVDAVELADEVRELRERREKAESAVAELLSKVGDTAAAEEPPPARAAPEPEPTPAAQPEPPAQPEPVAEIEPEPQPEPEPEPVAEIEPEPQPEPVAQPEPEPELVAEVIAEAEPEPAAPATIPADVDNLFAALRTAAGAPTSSNGAGGAAPAAAATGVAVKEATADPFELRDRLLLSVTNSTLRDAKKALVELQNQTLEELREVGEGWRPDRAVFDHAFRRALEALGQKALEAGFAAAAELAGSSAVPHPDNVAPTNPTNEVAGALFTDVDEVAQRAAASGAGHRQTTAAVSRVFRTWRTDAAERHLRAASLASYHDGVLWGLETLGVAAVKGVADGRMCAECPASVRAAWAPTDSTPKGTGIPPVHLDCACTIVPG